MKKASFLLLLAICRGIFVFAQGCSVCSNTAAALDDKGARGLNGGIIYLALLPLTIMITLGYLWWRANKSSL